MTTGHAFAIEPRRFMANAPARRKTASGGLGAIPHRRLSRWRLQGADTSAKNAASYDRARRVPHLAQSGQCASPATSSAEAAASQAGNRDAYWSSRLRRGDPLAATALGIVRSNTALGVAANTRLISAIISRNGANPGRDAINREVNQIGIEIMQAHVALVNAPGSPTAEQVAQYHFDIFAAHGLPPSTFGGAPITGSQTEAGLTSGIWMGGC